MGVSHCVPFSTFFVEKSMSIRKEDIDIDNPFNNFKSVFGMCFSWNRLFWNAGKENWKRKEHIARLTEFYSKHHPSKVRCVDFLLQTA